MLIQNAGATQRLPSPDRIHFSLFSLGSRTSAAPHSSLTFHSNHSLTTMALSTNRNLPVPLSRRAHQSTSASWAAPDVPARPPRESNASNSHQAQQETRSITAADRNSARSGSINQYPFPDIEPATLDNLINKKRSASGTSVRTTIVHRTTKATEE